MSKWFGLKVAALAASAMLFGGGCLSLGGLSWERIMPYVALGSIFD